MSPSTKEYERGTCSETRINCTFECWDRNNHERMLHTLEVDIFLEAGVDESSVKNIWENWSADCQKFFFNLHSFWTHICWFIWTKKKLNYSDACTSTHSCWNTDEFPAETSLTDGILSKTAYFPYEDGGCSGHQSFLWFRPSLIRHQGSLRWHPGGNWVIDGTGQRKSNILY